MADTETVILAHFYEGKQPGDKFTTDPGHAKQLRMAGVAQPADDKDKGEKAAASQPASKASSS